MRGTKKQDAGEKRTSILIICTLSQVLLGGQIKQDEIGGACGMQRSNAS